MIAHPLRLRIRVRADMALFTRPEMKVERVSYEVPTPSAARGIFEAVLWKPQMRWRVERIAVLAPIRTIAFRRNEVNRKAPTPTAALVSAGGRAPVLMADEDRAQRNAVALRNVDYIFEARIELTDRADKPNDTVEKYAAMFTRRLEKGQHFHQPYLGCRECVCDVSPPVGDEQPIELTRDLGLMLWDIDFAPQKPDKSFTGANTPIFYHARITNGVIEVPPTKEAARATLDSFRRAMESHTASNDGSDA
jgi:CRISPR-associated protein Cas5d